MGHQAHLSPSLPIINLYFGKSARGKRLSVWFWEWETLCKLWSTTQRKLRGKTEGTKGAKCTLRSYPSSSTGYLSWLDSLVHHLAPLQASAPMVWSLQTMSLYHPLQGLRIFYVLAMYTACFKKGKDNTGLMRWSNANLHAYFYLFLEKLLLWQSCVFKIVIRRL